MAPPPPPRGEVNRAAVQKKWRRLLLLLLLLLLLWGRLWCFTSQARLILSEEHAESASDTRQQPARPTDDVGGFVGSLLRAHHQRRDVGCWSAGRGRGEEGGARGAGDGVEQEDVRGGCAAAAAGDVELCGGGDVRRGGAGALVVVRAPRTDVWLYDGQTNDAFRSENVRRGESVDARVRQLHLGRGVERGAAVGVVGSEPVAVTIVVVPYLWRRRVLGGPRG